MNKLCTFCTNPEVKDRIVYENDLVMVFPTHAPIVPGHLLISPKRHVVTQSEVTDEEGKALLDTLKLLKPALTKSFNAEGFNVAWNEGELSGQSVPHLHIHLLPRKEGDKGVVGYEPREFLYRPGVRDLSLQEELKEVVELIQKNL